MDDPRSTSVVTNFVAFMDDDFNTARAIAGIGEGMKFLNELCDMKGKKIKKLPGGRPSFERTVHRVASDLREILTVLGLCKTDAATALESMKQFAIESMHLDRALIETKLAEREAARADKAWEKSDLLREELSKLGIDVRDTPTGSEWKVIR
jgi:cysteinyl-tRNA synthetase